MANLFNLQHNLINLRGFDGIVIIGKNVQIIYSDHVSITSVLPTFE